jgi:pimeloyl-ACP methyl ester carboxylesterase
VRVAVPVRARPIAIVLLGAIALAACGEPPPADLSGSRAVAFESRDGVTLEGRLFGDGSTGVVLSHMQPADQRSWFAFASRLADQGYLGPHVRLPGYCPGGDGGCSQGELQISAIWQDVLGAIDFIRSQGATTVALVGASMGGTASLVAAAQEGADVAGGRHPLGTDVDRGARTPTPPCSNAWTRTSCSSRVWGTRPPRRRPSSSTRSPRRRRGRPRSSRPTTTAPTLLTGSRGEAVQRIIETYLAQFAPA